MFPDFNIYSSPLLLLVLQGLILVSLLMSKAISKRHISYALLATLLFITCYHRTTYTIGFMGWYDTYRNTKINYYLIRLSLAVGPLIYLYIKSSVQEAYVFRIKEILHFIPVFIFVSFRLLILAYDSQQATYNETQNGELYIWVIENLSTGISILEILQMLLYLYLSFSLYYKFRGALQQEYSNTYKYELHWLHIFMILYASLFVYNTIQMFTDSYIFNLHWTQEWWFQFFSIVVVIYLGVKGYFTPIENLKKLPYDRLFSDQKTPSSTIAIEVYKSDIEKLDRLMVEEKLYLDPNLTLNQLSRKIRMNTSHLSLIINKGLQKNFNDYVNAYRVEEAKSELKNTQKEHLSILAIAYDSGFNSKATFNRVFKKVTGISPSQFRKQSI